MLASINLMFLKSLIKLRRTLGFYHLSNVYEMFHRIDIYSISKEEYCQFGIAYTFRIKISITDFPVTDPLIMHLEYVTQEIVCLYSTKMFYCKTPSVKSYNLLSPQISLETR